MVEEVVSYLNYSFFAEAALVLFAMAFALICIRTALQSRDATEQQARIPLEEGQRRVHHG
ncbi:MAG: hypothetical protein K1X74_22740 [Pirellulales bacterium]|nr:hypothetical protein [Pirellulales bacterium]